MMTPASFASPSRTGPQSRPVLLLNGIGSVWLWALLETVAFAMALPATIGLLMLFGWHVHLVLTNKSTIEYQEVCSDQHNLCELLQANPSLFSPLMMASIPCRVLGPESKVSPLGSTHMTWALITTCIRSSGRMY